ncbi:MAG: LytTR family DNA-binding domain-containing protein [Acutalibacteraceae bacterium]
MKFRLVIDRKREEELVAVVHERTPLIDEIEALVAKGGASQEIVGYDEEDIRLLRTEDIEAFYIENEKTYAMCTCKKRYRIKKPLYELEAILPPNFRRINKSNLANMHRIVRFKTSLSGAVDAEFQSGFRDYVSRRCFAQLKRRYSL